MDDRRLEQFLVESYLPGVSQRELNDADKRLIAASDALAASGEAIRYLGSTFVPAEESCFSRFEANNEESVRRACESAQVRYARILAAKPIRSWKRDHESRSERAMDRAHGVSSTLAPRHGSVSHDLKTAPLAIRVLTNAEEQVARLAATGLSDEEVAAELGLTTAVSSAHLSQVFRKLGTRSRTDLHELLSPRTEAKDGKSGWEA